jgi:hypothetical protein
LVRDEELPQAILQLVDAKEPLRPRLWALEHTGWRHSTHRLEDLLKGLAEARGGRWMQPLAAKKNAPNLQYVAPGDSRRFELAYDSLAELLRDSLPC